MNIDMGNSHSFLRDPLEVEDFKRIRKEFSFFVQGAQFTPQYISKQWDGRKYLFSDRDCKFPTGLMYKMVALLKELGYKPIINDKRRKPDKKFSFAWLYPFPLRDYQLECVEKGLKAQRGTLVCGTGGGKTVMGMRLAWEMGVKTLFIVNTKEAFLDTYNTAVKCFGDQTTIGTMGAGKKKSFGEFLTITTMGAVTNKLGKADAAIKKFIAENFDLVIIDECHHLGSGTWFDATAILEPFHRIGLTGTNFRGDNGSLLLNASTGRVFAEVPAKWLQDNGYLVKSRVYFIEVDHPDNLDRPLKFPEVYRCGVVRNNFRNKLVRALAEKHKADSVLVTVEKLEHGSVIEAELKTVDPRAAYVHNKTQDREELKKMFESGEITKVVATRVYNESVDIPRLNVVIQAAAMKSGNATVQRIGRQLRLFEGKNEAIMYDFYDALNIKLEDHSRDRIKWLKKEGHDVQVVKAEEILGKEVVEQCLKASLQSKALTK